MKIIFVLTKKPRKRRGSYGNRKKKDRDVDSGVNSDVSSTVNIVNNDCEGDDSLLKHRLSVLSANTSTASVKKVEPIDVSTPNSPYSATGNIIIDMEIFSSILNLLTYPSYSNAFNMKLSEVYSKKKGKLRVTYPGDDGSSSLNWVVTTISMTNEKVLGVEPMSRACKACLLKEKEMTLYSCSI